MNNEVLNMVALAALEAIRRDLAGGEHDKQKQAG